MAIVFYEAEDPVHLEDLLEWFTPTKDRAQQPQRRSLRGPS
jgi:hypothetical protein